MLRREELRILPEDEAWAALFRVPNLQALLRAALTRSDRWMRRTRGLGSMAGLVFVLMMVLRRDLSMPNVLMSMAVPLRVLDRNIKVQPITNEALLRRRRLLGEDTLQAVFEETARGIGRTAVLKGRSACVIDGTKMDVPDTALNREAFGKPNASRGTAAFPQVQFVTLEDVATRKVRAVVIQGCHASEQQAAWELMEFIERGEILFLDRGLASAALLEHARERGIDVVMRIRSDVKPKVLKVHGPGDYHVRLTGRPPKWMGDRRTFPVLARLITFRIGADGDIVRLATTLTDTVEFSAQELAEAYHLRWEIEITFDEVKTHLIPTKKGTAQTPFRSHLPELVRQEAYALLAVYNMVRELICEAATASGVNPHDISFVNTLELVRAAAPQFASAAPDQIPAMRRQLLEDIASFKNRRPRRPRRCPRKVKRKMSKWHIKGAKDREQRRNFPSEIELVADLTGFDA